MAGRPFDPSLLGVLENLANRGYTDGFYQRHHTQDYQNYLSNHSASLQQQFVGEVESFDSGSGLAVIDVKNKFAVGDSLEIMTPNGNSLVSLEGMTDEVGNPMLEALGGGYRVKIPLPPGDYQQALIAKFLR